jgi:hypothetical protein
MLKMARLSMAAAMTCAALTATTASAASVTFEIEIDGATGMFQAPDTGGLIESFGIIIDGVNYDMLGTGTAAPVYSATDNDIRGNPGTEGFIQNSVAGGGCLAMECVLGLESSVDPGVIPPLFAIFPLVGGFPGTVTNSGIYAITPLIPTTSVPLPASMFLLMSTLAILVSAGRLRVG